MHRWNSTIVFAEMFLGGCHFQSAPNQTAAVTVVLPPADPHVAKPGFSLQPDSPAAPARRT